MKGLKYFLKVIQVVILPFTFYRHVIYVYFNFLSNLLDEHLIHKSLVGYSNILQSKWHDFIAKMPLACDKRSLLLVGFVKLDLIVA